MIPVAVWLLEAEIKSVKTPELVRGLQGRLQSGEVLIALERLKKMGAVNELPHLGAPTPRHFEVNGDHPYWGFVEAIAVEVDEELSGSSASRRTPA